MLQDSTSEQQKGQDEYKQLTHHPTLLYTKGSKSHPNVPVKVVFRQAFDVKHALSRHYSGKGIANYSTNTQFQSHQSLHIRLMADQLSVHNNAYAA